MSDQDTHEIVFNSAFFFENETYVEHEDTVYANRKQIRENFEDFLISNLEELEFTENKKKSKKDNNLTYQYEFEEDKNHKIRVTYDSDGITIVALYKNKINGEIDEETVDKDRGEKFQQLMDRVMDALEVIECSIFDIPTKTQTNLKRTPKAIKRGREILAQQKKTKGKNRNKKSNDTTEEFDPDDEQSDSDKSDTENESESFEEVEVSKRRSKRLRKRKTKSNRKRKRKRKLSESDNENENDNDNESGNGSDSSNVSDKPKRKKRKLDKEEKRAMKGEFVKMWCKKEYVQAIHFAEDEYKMTTEKINNLIETIED